MVAAQGSRNVAQPPPQSLTQNRGTLGINAVNLKNGRIAVFLMALSRVCTRGTRHCCGRDALMLQLPGMRPFGNEKQYFAISPARVYQTRSLCLCSTQCLMAWRTGRSRKG
jgi:hypothetical protein